MTVATGGRSQQIVRGATVPARPMTPPDAIPTPPATRVASWPLEREGQEERTIGRRFLRDVIRGIGIVALLHVFVIQISVVRGHSMRPCLRDGDRLVVDRLTYSFADVDRFDIVVMRNPQNPSVDYVKRIVGLPGDKVRLNGGTLFINGHAVSEAFHPIHDAATTTVTVVPDGHFFVLGDNRPISCDSREFGLVKSSYLKGKVRMRFWPPERFEVF